MHLAGCPLTAACAVLVLLLQANKFKNAQLNKINSKLGKKSIVNSFVVKKGRDKRRVRVPAATGSPRHKQTHIDKHTQQHPRMCTLVCARVVVGMLRSIIQHFRTSQAPCASVSAFRRVKLLSNMGTDKVPKQAKRE